MIKKAYTLSEVLVVLLVLGIIAAFIIPAVMRTAPDRSSLLYKKTFYSMQEAVQTMINNDKLYYSNGTARHSGTLMDRVDLDGDGNDDSLFCSVLAKTLNIIGNANCGSNGTQSDPNFTTTNGVGWYFDVGNFTSTTAYKDINVNCNGVAYRIRVYADGRVTTDKDWTLENTALKKPFKFRDL